MALFENFVEDLNSIRSYSTQEERDAAAIRLGFQVTGPNQYSRTSGVRLDPAKVVSTLAGFVPAAGPALNAVAGSVGAVRDAFTTPKQLNNSTPSQSPSPSSYSPAPSAPATQQASFGGAGVLFLIIGAAVFMLFGKRGR